MKKLILKFRSDTAFQLFIRHVKFHASFRKIGQDTYEMTENGANVAVEHGFATVICEAKDVKVEIVPISLEPYPFL